MIKKIREWFFRLLTGMHLNEFILGNVEASLLRRDLTELQEVYSDLLKEYLHLKKSIFDHDEALMHLVKVGEVTHQNVVTLAKIVEEKDQTNYPSGDTGKLN